MYVVFFNLNKKLYTFIIAGLNSINPYNKNINSYKLISDEKSLETEVL